MVAARDEPEELPRKGIRNLLRDDLVPPAREDGCDQDPQPRPSWAKVKVRAEAGDRGDEREGRVRTGHQSIIETPPLMDADPVVLVKVRPGGQDRVIECLRRNRVPRADSKAGRSR